VLEIQDLLIKLEAELKRIIVERQLTNPLMIGIRTGGVWIAEQMHQKLNIKEPLDCWIFLFIVTIFLKSVLIPT